MKISMINSIKYTALLIGIATMPVLASAGTFKTITIDGDFSDWAGVPVLTTDTTADGDPADFVTLYAANDSDNFYIRVVYNVAVPLNQGNAQIFMALDNDSNVNTGFNVFGLGLVGSEVGWQNDFPFEQATGVFNTGNGITDGVPLIAPFGVSAIEQEIAISRSATFTVGGTTIFPNDTFGFAMYTSGAIVDDFIGGTLGGGAYTFAAVPEPSHAGIVLAVGVIGMLAYRRYRRS